MHKSFEVDKFVECLRKSKVSVPRVEWVRGRVLVNEVEAAIQWGGQTLDRKSLEGSESDMIWEDDPAWYIPRGKSKQNQLGGHCHGPDEKELFWTNIVRNGQILAIFWRLRQHNLLTD